MNKYVSFYLKKRSNNLISELQIHQNAILGKDPNKVTPPPPPHTNIFFVGGGGGGGGGAYHDI